MIEGRSKKSFHILILSKFLIRLLLPPGAKANAFNIVSFVLYFF
jgi:hypothetical protein